MMSDEGWIKNRINEASTNHPSITEEVKAQMRELLKSQLTEQQLSQKQIKSISLGLILAMTPLQKETEEKL